MTTAAPSSSYSPNADFWIEIIRKDRDRYRTELTNPAMLRAIGDVASLDMLDAGCGEGYLSRLLARRGGRLIGVDLCAELVDAARHQAQAENLDIRHDVADVATLPLSDASVDVVVANHLLNDLEDPAPAIGEFARVLRPDGRLVAIFLHPCFYGVRGELADVGAYHEVRRVEQHFFVDGERSPAAATVWLRPLEDHIRILSTAGLRRLGGRAG
jgi:ubiquinone/menaquinone biosynthesis C-methylase UbiE